MTAIIRTSTINIMAAAITAFPGEGTFREYLAGHADQFVLIGLLSP